MKTIKENTTNDIIIKNSRFITKLVKVNNIDDIDKALNDLKEEYRGATHYCYAYIIGNIKRFNDDGEPGGTAGMPILNVLEKNNLNNILCVVIRYFGGIKLGAGGLVRAYTKSVTEALKTCETNKLVKAMKIDIEFTHDKIKLVDTIVNAVEIENKVFDLKVKYSIVIENNKIDNILNNLTNNNIDITKKENCFIEK
ncbi:MAG TPA: YigZ family protein [Tenericutes bacterium]|nr:YigZ family protein [Mycoplasmatota bacterium]